MTTSQTLLFIAAACVALAWVSRDLLLGAAGHLLVSEDGLEPVEVLVASVADPAADTLEAARLYRRGMAREIVLCTHATGPVGEEIRRLGVPLLRPTELATQILERSGVPPGAIVVLPDLVDGTSTEMAAIARFAQQRRPPSLLLIMPRSHTARARYLLRRALPAETRLLVRGPGATSFADTAWWRNREQAREVLAEYLRWVNTLVFGDHWNGLRAASHP